MHLLAAAVAIYLYHSTASNSDLTSRISAKDFRPVTFTLPVLKIITFACGQDVGVKHLAREIAQDRVVAVCIVS